MHQIRIGVREAKIHLSRLLEDVQNGKEIIITNHGKPVGKIIPVPQESLTLGERIERLERQGWIGPSGEKEETRLPSPLPVPDEIAQRYLQEDRDS
jgi:prevent-host-death family protein